MKCLRAALCLAAACLATTASGARQSARARTPVEKVVTLLKDLKTKIEQDGKSESQTYDKYACWCEKTTARKAASIEDALEQLRALGQTMLKTKGTIATLASEIQELEQNIQANQKAQAEQTSIRQKENAAYTAETTEMKEVLAALEKAIIVLREGTKPSSFLQQGTAAGNALKAVIEALPSSASLKPKQASLLSEFAAQGEGARYAPQSWTVQGILGDMYDTFSADLESATGAEAAANRAFEDFIAVKTQELQAMQAEKAQKEGEKAEAEALLADTTQSYDDTLSQKQADIAFFDETKAACESKHAEWSTRGELREEELRGIAEAIRILTADSARELFASAIKAGKETGMDDSYDTGVGKLVSFVQVNAAGEAPEHAYEELRGAARTASSLRLAALAVRIKEAKVGHFDAVLKSIDDMLKTLRDEDAADIAKRDQCKEEYKKINSTVANIEWLIQKNQAAIDKLTRLIQELTDEKVKTIDEINEVEAQMAAMTKQRKAENGDFLNAKAEDQSAIRLLASARTALSSYYSNHSIELGPIQGSVKGLALAQQGPDFDVSADQAPDAVFSGKGHRKRETKGIVQLLAMIMEDLNDEIKNDMGAEELAQLDYEKQMAAATKLRDSLVAKRINLSDMISKRTQDKGNEEADMAANKGDLKNEQDYKASIAPDCDWIIGAFGQRAARRTAEMQGLTKAREFLAGYQPSSLLERKGAAFDDASLASISFHGIQH